MEQPEPELSRIAYDAEELAQRAVTTLAMALIVASALAWLLVTPGRGFRMDRFAVFMSLFLEGLAIYWLRNRRPPLARAILLLGPCVSYALALRVFVHYPLTPGFALLIIIANAAVHPSGGIAAAALASVPVFALSPSPQNTVVATLLIWLCAALLWMSSRGTHTALQWAWNSQQRANALLGELRERRAELRRAVDALTEATRRLQRTGYELALARLRADEARRLKEQFAANVSHELRTPLNLILGFAEVMYFSPEVYGDMEWPAALRSDVRQIYQSSRQLLDLLADVIDLARTDMAQMPMHREATDLRAIVEEVLHSSSRLAHRHGLELRTAIPDNLPTLHVDQARIRQVLLNLVNNALRFTEKGSIEVRAEVGEREVVVSVSDTGTGIAPEELARIFDEFYQVDMSLRRPRQGAGLGLAISKRFVELHGGRMWAESRLGAGSTFRFSLPRAPHAAVTAPSSSPARAPHPDRDPPCVLAIDADPGVGDTLGRHLQGYRVVQAPDIDTLPHWVDQHHPQAIFVNVRPGSSPDRLVNQALALLPERIPVLACSLPSQSWLRTRESVRTVLSKPISKEPLLQALSGLGPSSSLLVVDDDRGFVQLVNRLLQTAGTGHDVVWALNGEEALLRIRERRPDLILLDLAMPGMNGLELLDHLDSDASLRSIPVVIVTATDQAHNLLAQCRGFLTVGRKASLSAGEVLRLLQKMLDAVLFGDPAHAASAYAAAAPE
ncbi:MAG: ATP-binding response regulator [Anaerolineae bacterium]